MSDSIFVRHHHGDCGLRVVNVQCAASGDEFDKPRCAVVVADIERNRDAGASCTCRTWAAAKDSEAALRKLDLIDFIPDSQGETQIKTFQGRRVIVDDGCPSRAGTTDGVVYTTYLFGLGSFGMGFADLNGAPVEGGHGTEGCEMARDALNSDTFLVNRRRFILHPRGVKFTSASVAGANPTNAELATAANWIRVWENKNVPVVAVTHNI